MIPSIYYFYYTKTDGTTASTWFFAKDDTHAENKMRGWAMNRGDIASWRIRL